MQEPQSVLDAIEEYRSENDMYADFKRDCITKESDLRKSISLVETYDIFKEWYKTTCDGKIPRRTDMKSCLEKKMGKYPVKTGWSGYSIALPLNQINNEEDEKHIIESGILDDFDFTKTKAYKKYNIVEIEEPIECYHLNKSKIPMILKCNKMYIKK